MSDIYLLLFILYISNSIKMNKENHFFLVFMLHTSSMLWFLWLDSNAPLVMNRDYDSKLCEVVSQYETITSSAYVYKIHIIILEP